MKKFLLLIIVFVIITIDYSFSQQVSIDFFKDMVNIPDILTITPDQLSSDRHNSGSNSMASEALFTEKYKNKVFKIKGKNYASKN